MTLRHATAAALGCALLSTAVHATPEPGFTETPVVGGLDLPTALAFLPDGRMLVTEKGGFGGEQNARLLLVDGGTATEMGTVPVCTDSEMGLLGVAVDPDFGANGSVYLYRSFSATDCGSSGDRFNEVIRVTIGPGDTVVPGSLTVSSRSSA